MSGRAPKQPKCMMPCGECGKARPIGIEHMNNIEAGKSVNICRECVTRAKPNHGLGENEIRRKVNGKFQIRVVFHCEDCGKIGYHARHKHPTRCKPCAADWRKLNSKRTALGSFTPATAQPAKPKAPSRPPGEYPIYARKGTRCRGLRDGCPKYWDCLTEAEDWPGWTCGDGSEPLRYIYYVEDKADLKQHWLNPVEREDSNPFELMSVGFDLSRSPRR